MTAPEDVLRALRARELTLAVAESDTGGLLLDQLTSIPGSSAVVLGGVVAYHDELKPVGLAFVAAVSAERSLVRAHHWQGDRQANRAASAEAALQLALELLKIPVE